MRWDNRGRLWVSCSLTYPHVYPGNEPNDKLVILEDVDGDGRADKSTVFADDLHIPLSFELVDNGVIISDMPNLTLLRDTNGDDRVDEKVKLLSGFGTEDSHHALHDFTWTPTATYYFASRSSIIRKSRRPTVPCASKTVAGSDSHRARIVLSALAVTPAPILGCGL